MKLRQYQVDAFTARCFGGNPAAVVPLAQWLDDNTLQAIAEENNLSETAFFVPEGEGYRLRWFTPVREVKLCGHATLATAHVMFEHLNYAADSILFHTLSGELRVARTGSVLRMDFPSQVPELVPEPDVLSQALGLRPKAVLKHTDYLVVLESEADVRTLAPDMALLSRLEGRGVIVTAPGDEVDFVSRFFAPKYGIAEDPVTGSAHCQLVPYWAARLARSHLAARQVSRRGGELDCELQGDRVMLGGRAVTFMVGDIFF